MDRKLGTTMPHKRPGEYVVYTHSNKNGVFYVGCGQYGREFDLKERSRTKEWLEEAKKFNSIYVEAVLETTDKDEAIDKEAELIAQYGRLYDGSGVLVNFSKRATGRYKEQPEVTKKRTEVNIGRAHSEERKANISRARQKLFDTNAEFAKRNAEHCRSIAKSGADNKMSIPITIDGVTYESLRIASKETGIKYGTLYDRLKNGRNLTGDNASLRSIEIDGVVYNTLKEAAESLGVNYGTFKSRVKVGYYNKLKQQ